MVDVIYQEVSLISPHLFLCLIFSCSPIFSIWISPSYFVPWVITCPLTLLPATPTPRHVSITPISITNSTSEYPQIREVISLSTGPFQGPCPIGWDLPSQAPTPLPGSHWKGLACRDQAHSEGEIAMDTQRHPSWLVRLKMALCGVFVLPYVQIKRDDLSLLQRQFAQKAGPGSVIRAFPDKPWYICLGTKMKFRGLGRSPTGLITGSHLSYVPEWWLWIKLKRK